MDKKEVIDQVKILIQVGDMQYLDKLLTKYKINSAGQY